jgi:PII-like signaling protein
MRMKMLCITIRMKRNDEVQGKRLHNVLLDFLMQNKIAGATVWTGVDGFGKRKRATIKLEGITINMPLIIEVIDEQTKLEPLLPQIKRMVDDNGLITLHQVDII